jgi:hypothetical protein
MFCSLSSVYFHVSISTVSNFMIVIGGHPISVLILHPGSSTVMVDWDVFIIYHVLYLEYNNNSCHYSTVYLCPLFLCINSFMSQNSFTVVSISTCCTNRCVCLLIWRHSVTLNILQIYNVKFHRLYGNGQPGWQSQIVTCYRLDGPLFKPQWRPDFLYASRLVMRPTQPPVQYVLGLFSGHRVTRAWHCMHPHCITEVKVHSYSWCPPFCSFMACYKVNCTMRISAS